MGTDRALLPYCLKTCGMEPEYLMLSAFHDLRYSLRTLIPPILFSVIPEIGLDIDFKPNAIVFAYMFVISLITGVVFGLAPAIESTKPNLTDALKSTKSRPRISRPRLRKSTRDWAGGRFAGAADRRGFAGARFTTGAVD